MTNLELAREIAKVEFNSDTLPPTYNWRVKMLTGKKKVHLDALYNQVICSQIEGDVRL